MARLDPTGVSRILSYIKTWVTNALGGKANSSHSHADYIPKSGGGGLGTPFSRAVNNNELRFDGGTTWDDGGSLVLYGKNNSSAAGAAVLRASNGTQGYNLTLYPDGSLTWGGTAISLSGHTHTKSQITDFPTIPSNTSQLTNDSGYITSSGSCNYANSAGWANSAGGVAWDNVSGKPSAFTPYFANGTWYAVGDDAAIGDHNVGGGLGVKALNSTTTRIDLCYSNDASNYKSITYDGTTLYMNGNCDYATSAGSCSSSTYSTYLNSLGVQTPKSGRDIFHPGVYTYTTFTDTNTPAHYGAVIGYGNGQGGSCEMFAEWVGSGQLWFRVLRDWQDSWTSWEKINTESNTVLNGYRIYVG